MARIDDFKEALRLASQQLATGNLHRICMFSGTTCVVDANGGPRIAIPFMNEELVIQVHPEKV